MDKEEITLVCVEDRYCTEASNLLSQQKKLCGLEKSILFGSSKQCDIIIGKINCARDYSNFIIKDLYKYIKTNFVLIIQLDGFVLNPSSWINDFYNYDYIGAAWNWIEDKYCIGNGGFSFRSSKLLNLCKDLDYTEMDAPEEDVFICRSKKEYLASLGVKFATREIADKFSVENGIYTGQFGFHGKNTIAINKKLGIFK